MSEMTEQQKRCTGTVKVQPDGEIYCADCGWHGTVEHRAARQKQPPSVLRIIDGELVCADGSDVREYLRAFAVRAGITPDTPVNVVRRERLTQADALEGWGA